MVQLFGAAGRLDNPRVGGRGMTHLVHASAVAFLVTLEGTARAEVRFVDRELEADALSWLRQQGERDYSFVDATSFAVMRKLGIREALAFGGAFAAAGFVELRP
jgi:uncharacterized protein